MRWLGLLGLVALSECVMIIPLTKTKTMQRNFQKKYLLKNFQREHGYRLSQESSLDSNFSSNLPRNPLNITYVGNITIGTPSQEFRFMFDTGSSDFWVSSIYCQSPSCSRQILFNPKASTTFRPSNQQFKSIHRSWWMEGVLGFDTIQIGILVAVNQSFGLSRKQYNALMEHTPYDGILGLGYSNFTIQGIAAVFDNLKKQGVICQPVFAFYFSREKEDGSAVMFCGVDHTYYKGELSWVPVSQVGFWQIAMERISMNGTIMGCSGGCQAILDTGVSLLIGPSSLVAGIQRFINPRITQDGEFSVPCNKISTLPPLIFTINGKDYPVPAQAYVQKVSENLCINRFQRDTESLRPSETWILGDVFLSLYFSAYDLGNYRTGLAPAV